MSSLNILEFAKEHFSDEHYKLALESIGLDKLDQHWTTQLQDIDENLSKTSPKLYNHWKQQPHSSIPIKEYIKVADSPLEILVYCLEDENQLTPPPAVLILIARFFTHYIYSGGDISLEEAFYGSPKGKGVYASRDRSMLFHRFDYLVKNEMPNGTSQEEYLYELIQVDEPPIGSFNTIKEDEIDSFLRRYRRWKNRNLPDK